MVTLVPEILLILEDWIEILHTRPRQNANVPDHTRDASNREGSSGKSYEDDFVSGCVVCTDKTVYFTYVFRDARPKKSSCKGVYGAGTRTDSRMVVNDLRLAIEADSPESS